MDRGNDPGIGTSEGKKRGEGRKKSHAKGWKTGKEDPRLGEWIPDECTKTGFSETRRRATSLDCLQTSKGSWSGKKGGEKSGDSNRRDCGFGLSVCGQVDLSDPRK